MKKETNPIPSDNPNSRKDNEAPPTGLTPADAGPDRPANAKKTASGGKTGTDDLREPIDLTGCDKKSDAQRE